ncbi:tetratricopeptide repeat protein [Sneathiella sp. P13V-1]|uniref:tetratricopeptide repeat-containing sulfotransferase family protein n=1 Tax=Sneathiella sp. P13V-1 TaxID=2697366 RepID=UPI00187B9A27|nr:tetratricopeptide repeat-containing sulfotransferase family protein [Sneathiella sp. P13V-1]MBE7637533.1 tetratricopeptide repeat protein [Sneathiella sp. P13V-1]
MSDVSELSALMEAGQWEKAEEICVKSIDSGKPYRFQVVIDYVDVARRLNHQLEAISRLQTQSSKYPQIAGFYDELGKLYWSLNERAKAIEFAEKAVRRSPETAAYYNSLGNYHRYSQNYKKADYCYRKVIALLPENSQGYINLSRVLIDNQQIDEGIKYFKEALLCSRDDQEKLSILYGSIVTSLLDKNLGEDALSVLDSADKDIQKQAYYLQAKAKCLVHLNRLKEADEVLKQALVLAPDNEELLNDQGLLLRKVGRPGEAEEAFENVLKLDKTNYEAWLNLGNLYKSLDLDHKATEAFKRAYEICPNEISAICSYARHKSFVKGDPDIEKIRNFLVQKGLTEKRQNHLKIALAKALDDIGEHREAFRYCHEANQYMKTQEDFNIEAHRQRIVSLSKTFREKRLPLDTASEPLPRLLLVTGMSRSGKTLVEKVLRQSPDVVALGEDRMWFEEMLALSRKLKNRSKPQAVGTIPRDKLEEITRNYLNRLLDIHGPAKVYVNTLPSSFMFIALMFSVFPNFKVIDCRRDPLDQVIETYFKHYEEGNGYSTDLSWSGEYWFHYRSLMEQWHQLYGENMMTVRYEDLVTKTDEMIEKIFDFSDVGVPRDMSEIAFSSSRIGKWKNYEPEMQDVITAFANIQNAKTD